MTLNKQVRLNKAACKPVFLQKNTLPPFSKFTKSFKLNFSRAIFEGDSYNSTCKDMYAQRKALVLLVHQGDYSVAKSVVFLSNWDTLSLLQQVVFLVRGLNRPQYIF